jgi:mRNA interferase MazF
VIRGDVCWYRFRPPDKRRPVLILTRDSAGAYLHEVTVAPITTRIRIVPSEVWLGPDDGMPQECAVNLYYLQTVPRGNIGRVIGHLSSQRMAEVRAALLFALGFDET